MIKIESKLALRSYEEKTGAAAHLEVDVNSEEQICAEIVGVLTVLERNYPIELMAALQAIMEGVVEDENN